MNGNRTTITENDGSVTTNVFDNKNRLTRELRTGLDPYVCNYAYDLNDSLISRDLPGGGNVGFTLDNCARITADSAGTAYSWDPDGRLLSRIGGLGTVTFSYDYADRVTGMTVGSGASPLTLAYFYNGDGGLQYLRRNGLRSQFLLDGRDVLREWLPLTITRSTDAVALRPRDLVRLNLNVLNQSVVDYTHGLGLISQRITTLTTNPQTYSTDYFRWDGRATSRRQEDPSKADTNDTVYDAYGLLRSPKTLTSAYGFVGEEGVRQEKGLAPDLVVPYHMRARMYDPLLGRFTSRDPVWDVNLYEYGRDNPWSNIDPGGMQTEPSPDEATVYRMLRQSGGGGGYLPPVNFSKAELGAFQWAGVNVNDPSSGEAIILRKILHRIHSRGVSFKHFSDPEVQELWSDLIYFRTMATGGTEASAAAARAQWRMRHHARPERILPLAERRDPVLLFTLEGTVEGLKTGGAATLNVFTFNQSWLYDPGEFRNMPGFGGSVASATIGREVLISTITLPESVAAKLGRAQFWLLNETRLGSGVLTPALYYGGRAKSFVAPALRYAGERTIDPVLRPFLNLVRLGQARSFSGTLAEVEVLRDPAGNVLGAVIRDERGVATHRGALGVTDEFGNVQILADLGEQEPMVSAHEIAHAHLRLAPDARFLPIRMQAFRATLRAPSRTFLEEAIVHSVATGSATAGVSSAARYVSVSGLALPHILSALLSKAGGRPRPGIPEGRRR